MSKDRTENIEIGRDNERGREKQREDKKKGDRMDTLIGMVGNLTAEIKEMRKEQKEYKEEMLGLKKELNDLRQENQEIKKENIEIKEELKKVHNRMERLEKDKKENNIIIKGLKIPSVVENVNCAVETFIKDELDVVVTVKKVFKMGEKMFLAELAENQDKTKIMLNKKKLRYRQGEPIYIDNDFTQTEREIERQIRIIANKEKAKGKKVTIKYMKLIVDGVEFKWNKETEKLEEIVVGGNPPKQKN